MIMMDLKLQWFKNNPFENFDNFWLITFYGDQNIG